MVILSAPSGGGKTTIAQALRTARDDVGYSVSATTRQPREGEEDGVDYFFLTPEEFQRRIDANEFMEWARYGGSRYGTLVSEVERILKSGKHVVLDIEVQGARAIRERLANVVSIFILPPSARVLRERLTDRSTEHGDTLGSRLQHAVDEVAEAPDFDYIVTNDDRAQAVAEVAGIIDAESQRPMRLPGMAKTLNELRDALAEQAQSMRHRS
ncbi:MAG: guanylate kinase [Gemmatimonadetes bacterium]|nr:guanylate kinase [Gemmatimonadota bacterium]